jgi:hypothetical protein
MYDRGDPGDQQAGVDQQGDRRPVQPGGDTEYQWNRDAAGVHDQHVLDGESALTQRRQTRVNWMDGLGSLALGARPAS